MYVYCVGKGQGRWRSFGGLGVSQLEVQGDGHSADGMLIAAVIPFGKEGRDAALAAAAPRGAQGLRLLLGGLVRPVRSGFQVHSLMVF